MSKELYVKLDARGLLEYGSDIPGQLVRDILGIEMPAYGTKKQFDEAALAELGAIDYVRNILLGKGRYLAGSNGDYRVLLPSENKRQVDLYMGQADKKLRRALKLSRNAPTTTMLHDNTSVRIMLKRESIREYAAA